MPNATEIAIKCTQLQYLRDLLEEVEIEWTAHNDLVDAARRDLAVFFDVECTPSGFEQYRHVWNLVGFYVLISRLRERIPVIIFTAEEIVEAKKQASELYQELLEENPEQEALRQLEADFYEEYGGLDSRDPNW